MLSNVIKTNNTTLTKHRLLFLFHFFILDKMSWQDCIINKEYQIFTEFPYQIRRKTNKRIVKEAIDNKGYVYVCLNRRSIRKHRIVGIQFIPNPENLPQIDHINHDKTDYHLSNLRWVDNATNQQNCGSTRGVKHEFFDKIPCEDESQIITVDEYNGYTFENLFYHDNYFYYYNGYNYKRAHVHNDSRSVFIYAYDTTHKQRKISYLKFKRLYNIN